jgi:hypothetical protein
VTTPDAQAAFHVSDTTAPTLRLTLNGQELYNGLIVPAHFTVDIDPGGNPALDCAIDDGGFFACPSSTLPVSLAFGGSHLLTVRATDAAGNSTTSSVSVKVNPKLGLPDPPPPASGAPATPPPAPLPLAKTKLAKIKPKKSGSKVLLPVSAQVTLPAGVSLSAGCTGKAALSAAIGKKIVGKGSAALKAVKGKCSLTGTLKLKKKVVAGKKVAVSVTFGGNGVIGAFSAKSSVKLGR